jgi:hypothetical protein
LVRVGHEPEWGTSPTCTVVDYSMSSPRALKKKEITMWSFIVLRALTNANFINVDFPVPAFPLIHRKP